VLEAQDHVGAGDRAADLAQATHAAAEAFGDRNRFFAVQTEPLAVRLQDGLRSVETLVE